MSYIYNSILKPETEQEFSCRNGVEKWLNKVTKKNTMVCRDLDFLGKKGVERKVSGAKNRWEAMYHKPVRHKNRKGTVGKTTEQSKAGMDWKERRAEGSSYSLKHNFSKSSYEDRDS